LIRVGINDFYSSGGNYNYLQDVYGLTAEKIVNTILLNLKHEK
jgi:transketolase C-terminal domain/subunit